MINKKEVQLNIDTMERGPLYCIKCECPITEENDSGWNRFEMVGGVQRTRPICKKCNEAVEPKNKCE